MNDLHWFPYQALRPAGWVLVHAFWQTAALALLYQGLALALRDRSPRIRYVLGCACLVAAIVGPPVTVWLASSGSSTIGPDPTTTAQTVATPAAEHSGAHAATQPQPPATSATIAATLDPWTPRLLALWGLGAAVAALRLSRSWRRAHRLIEREARPAPATVVQHLAHLQDRLDIARPVRVRRCGALDSPALLGWHRPVILLPTAAAELPARELEPVLAHELAHVTRHDYAVNVVQALIECLLFFQPAAHWLSRQVRRERELCCDDLAANCCEGGAIAYARGLADLEAQRLGQPALAVTDGNLLVRIRRLVDPAWSARPRPLLATGLVVASLLLAGSASALLPASRSATVLGGLDPVQLIDGRERTGLPRYAAEHDGYRYLFVDAASRAAFLADPERYGVVNVAICPATGRTVRADIFRVIDGRIVLFCCPEIRGSDLRVARTLPSLLQTTLPD